MRSQPYDVSLNHFAAPRTLKSARFGRPAPSNVASLFAHRMLRADLPWPWTPEPCGQCVGKPWVGKVSGPGDVSVRADQNGGGSGDLAQDR